MPDSVSSWKEIPIYRYIKKDKLVKLLQNKGKEKELELKEEEFKIRYSNDICYVHVPSDWEELTDDEIKNAMEESNIA